MFWSPTGGGVRRYLTTKRDWLSRQGWRHTIVAPGTAGAGFGDCGGVPLPFSVGYRLPVQRGRAAAAIAAPGPDLIEVGDPYRLAWAALDAGQRLGVPTLAFCHSNVAALAALLAGTEGSAARFARRAAEAYLARTYRRFDCVLAPSESMAAELRALGLACVERQPLGVDTQLFHPRRHDVLLRSTLGLPRDARLLLYAGRFAPEKNLGTLVAAVQRLGPPYVLVAVGSGPLPPHGERVRVLPHEARTERLAGLLASADVFLQAGDQETFGLAALEAMACGTPVVVRDAAALGELVAEGGGTAVGSANPAAWAEAIAAIFTADRSSIAAAARRRAEEFAWEHALAAMLERYRRLLGARIVPLAA